MGRPRGNQGNTKINIPGHFLLYGENPGKKVKKNNIPGHFLLHGENPGKKGKKKSICVGSFVCLFFTFVFDGGPRGKKSIFRKQSGEKIKKKSIFPDYLFDPFFYFFV